MSAYVDPDYGPYRGHPMDPRSDDGRDGYFIPCRHCDGEGCAKCAWCGEVECDEDGNVPSEALTDARVTAIVAVCCAVGIAFVRVWP